MSVQFRRKLVLIVSTGTSGLDLSEARVSFQIVQSDTQTPNYAIIRVYNLSDQTIKSIQEFTDVTLQAGYQPPGNFGQIFIGSIKQVRRGRVNQTDTYVDIYAADSDLHYNFAVVNTTLPAGSTADTQLNALGQSMDLPVGYKPDLPKGALSRGKVLYGAARDYLRDLAASTDTTWSVQSGKIVMIPLTGYIPGTAIVLTSSTGMIGLPEQTAEGIKVRTLLNPQVKIGVLVQIDNKSVQQALASSGLLGQRVGFIGGNDVQNTPPGQLPRITEDGFYRVYVAEHTGDTRGNAWYSDLVCLGVDPSASPDSSVKAYG